ncbi:MAG: HD domain-containing protein, partial [Candidatus Micrarchaeota archaeon]|nr:HD domain-containing protein [Candidatus Micrarchaeota archaeon]
FGRYAHREMMAMRDNAARRLGREASSLAPSDYLPRSLFSHLARHSRRNPTDLFDRQGIIQMYYAGLLHDVGKRRKGIPAKVQVPLEVLQKPGQLHFSEFSMMRRHPLAAAYALKDLPLDHPILLSGMQHHGNWDGKGSYPFWYDSKKDALVPLKGAIIHPYAQFVALADVMDALVSMRPYPKVVEDGKRLDQFSLERTLDELKGMKGKYSPFTRRVLARMMADSEALGQIRQVYEASNMQPPLRMARLDELESKTPKIREEREVLSEQERARIQKAERDLTLDSWRELHRDRKVAKIAS